MFDRGAAGKKGRLDDGSNIMFLLSKGRKRSRKKEPFYAAALAALALSCLGKMHFSPSLALHCKGKRGLESVKKLLQVS